MTVTVSSPRHELVEQLHAELDRISSLGLLRKPRRVDAGAVVLCSNDYLGLGSLPIGNEAAGGAGASRLVSGNTAAHEAAERALAEWLEIEETLLFSSGYAANVGLLSALVRPGDLVVSDALNHASIIDGCRLSKARVAVVPHLDAGAVALTLEQPAAHRWVVTESVFSMDGDTPDLVELRRVCDRAGAFLVVDEAHAIGVLGPEGAGLCRSVGVEPDVMVGTLGKALGLQGAFVGGRAPIRDYLWNRARSFVFSTGLSPALAAAVPDRVARVREMEGARETICARGRRLAALFGLRRRVDHPVVPWLLGDEQRALCVETRLLEHGFFAGAIRPPTVPAGTARIRLATGVGVREDDFERAFDLIGALRSEL